MKKTIEWTTRSGAIAVVTLSLETERSIDADGYKITIEGCKIVTDATVNGVDTGGYMVSKIDKNHPASKLGAVAVCGKLCIMQEQYDEIAAARAELEASPEWQAKIGAEKAASEAAKEYYAGREEMRKIMGY